ncbi:DNA-dependent protein kinase catalytic subunit-like [Hetaerina americana]|uniref:DNA-dependent protein kinase catalytic subunit-like n=1 Tax=Hetaerina americana TaxID=62018 RepID=UPI003A7F5067
MFFRLNKDLEEPNCPIFLMSNKEKLSGIEMVKHFMKRCWITRNSVDHSSPEEINLLRKCRCAAHNALVAIVANLRTETKYYKYLFQENLNAGKKLWECLVDTSFTMYLPKSFDKTPEVIAIDASIHDQDKSRKKMRWDPSLQGTVHLTTQEFLADSTLNEDITKFDYQHCSVRSLSRTMRELNNHDVEMEDGNTSNPAFVMHEKDPANEHECMIAVTSLIQHMVNADIFPHGDSPEDFDWINSLKEALEYRDRHINVKIFLVRLILNCEEELAPYASTLMAPIMNLVAHGGLGNHINYLVIDVIQMLLKWHEKNPGINLPCSHVTGIFNFLALKAEESKDYIFKSYKYTIRSMYNAWKDLIEIPYDEVMEKCMDRDCQKLGLFLSSLFLENSKLPWRPETKERFLRCLLIILQDRKNALQLQSARVVGQTLRTMDPEQIGEDAWISLEEYEKEFRLSVIRHLQGLLKAKELDSYLKCMMEIQYSYSCVSDEYNTIILGYLPKLFGKLHTIALNIICSRVETLERPFLELNDKGLEQWLTTNVPENQQIALNMVMKILPKLREEELVKILPRILSFHCHSSTECRKIMYEILIWIFDKYSLADWEQTPVVSYDEHEVTNQSWTDQCVKTLLYGLIDEDKSIQSIVSTFFEGKPGLKLNDPTPERFVTIVDKLYSPATESSFLGYALNLLLSPSASTPDYQWLLFDQPLAKCVFEDYQPRTSHRTLDLDMTPMFTQSLARSLARMDITSQSQAQYSSAMSSIIKASQRSMAFSSTPGTSLSSDNAFLLSIGTGSNVGSMDGGSTSLGSYSITKGQEFKIPQLPKRKRHLNKPLSKSYYAGVENAKSTQRMEMAEEKIRKLDSEVTLHRKFRIGAFPDIQIYCYDILKPLRTVAQRDPVIAQQLFVSLFGGIWKKVKESNGCFTLLLLQGREAFKKILKNTKQFSGPLISAILEIALSNISSFPLNVDSVMRAIGPCGLSPLACLFLEARLNQWLPNQHTKLYDRSEVNNHRKIWLQLAMIYQDMEEYDVVHGIFHDMMKCGDNVKEALEFERTGQWNKGKAAYNSILSNWTHSDTDDETEFVERDYHYERYFECLASLSQWNDLNKVIMKQLDDSFAEAWDDETFWIPWLIKAQVNCGLEQESNADEYFKYISGPTIDSDQRIYLQSNYSREIALIHTMFGQYDKARFLVQKYYNSFLDEWPHLSPLSTKIKAPKLLNTQLTSELSLFLSSMKSHGSHQFIKDINRLCSTWKVNLPNQMEPLSHWEHRIACRHFFIRKIIADVGGVINVDEESIDLRVMEAQMSLSLVDMAISAKHFQVADKYLKKSEAVLKNNADSALRLPWCISQAFLPWLKGLNKKSDRDSQLKLYVEAWDRLVHILEDPQLSPLPELHLKVIQKIYTVSKTVHSVIKMSPVDVDNFDCNIKMNIFRLIGYSTTSTSSLIERITEYGVKQLEQTVDIAQALSESCIADQYLELGKYCQYLMEDTPGKYEELCMKAILRAMAYGSPQARQWFPCILQLPGLYSSLSVPFQTESFRVPTWMYLSWTSQILAHLNDSSCSTLSDLIVRMAETYPSAIVFPFRVSSDKYEKENSGVMAALKYRLEKILFKNQVLENLLKSLAYVSVPKVMLEYYVTRIITHLESPKPNIEEVAKANSLMMSEVFLKGRGNRAVGAQYNGSLLHSLKGLENKICEVMSGLSLIKTGGQAKALIQKLKCITNGLRYNSSTRLQAYSKWLSEYRSSGWGECVEIPGQYTGDHEPRVEEHVKIVGFLPKVTVMQSLRRPICLTIIGSDAKEHKFLVKFGEDLRLDQRIEQLFGIMNKILAVNTVAKERKLGISTYQVIPLTSNLGVIEWVDNTIPLYNMLFLSKDDQEKKRRQVMEEYIVWLEGAGKPLYNTAYQKYSREETIRSFKKRAEAFPCDMLRSSLLKLSLSYDSFWSLRNTFATSHATLCIAHWLLGIGDRHLQNTLVSMRTGRVIGIDFGYSFGTTTQFLGVPELMPFRLTPQIIGLMQPCGEVGLMKETMIHTLRALQENHDILLATMDVFVKEPSVDWLDCARKRAKADGISAAELEECDLAYPKEKIKLTRRKFVGGTNPREITLEEIGSRTMDNPAVQIKYKEVAAGDPEHNVRARLPSIGLSCEQQVSCLIDQATDYHILGKTWQGWAPWL